MQAIGIVSVLASACVALAATLVAARTQIRLHRLQRTDERLAELRNLIDSAAQALVRAKYRLADSEDLRESFDWDRELCEVEARLQVRLGSDSSLYDGFMVAWGSLDALKKRFAEDAPLSDSRAVELWEDVNAAMDRFFSRAALVVGPEPLALEAPDHRPLSARERLRELRDRWDWWRFSRRYLATLERGGPWPGERPDGDREDDRERRPWR